MTTAERATLIRLLAGPGTAEQRLAKMADVLVASAPADVPVVPDVSAKPKLVGIERVMDLANVGRARAYVLAKRLPGRVDLGDHKLRWSDTALTAFFVRGGTALPKPPTPKPKRRAGGSR